jgi:short-subunit dehydrogenase
MAASTYRTALITGASAGMGAEFARQLAAAGTNLILVARRKEKLDALAAELTERQGVVVEVLQADLASPDGIEVVRGRIASADALDLLINNAGFGGAGPFSKSDVGYDLGMVHVQIDAAVTLSRAALDGMVSRGRGAIINVASVAAFSAVSGPMYGGCKAFLVKFSEGLQYELEDKGVRIQALCPGMTHTEFHDVIKMDKSTVPAFMWMSATDVVRISLRTLGRRKVVCIPGLKNRLVSAPMRCAPTAWLLRKIVNLPAIRRKAGV